MTEMLRLKVTSVIIGHHELLNTIDLGASHMLQYIIPYDSATSSNQISRVIALHQYDIYPRWCPELKLRRNSFVGRGSIVWWYYDFPGFIVKIQTNPQ